MKALKIIQAIWVLLPQLVTTIKTVEEMIPSGGNGADKLEFVRETIQSVYDSGHQASVTFDELWPALQSTIKSIVALFNKSGQFRKEETPAA
jgi:hypothetical protein